ncbi:helix-turn-helix transcriptional regulator [Salipiger sp. HF18]|uniref:helix-turn-helix domain-containing protein n=1 Tax=Salipiger sp. HF18 TaxID=2721557 RepID=UPI00142DBD6D|nr:helix-turn-helix domain-containing protein [Salipiger sp. HF18]NIY95560.1 helix-turn-helix transcriptional regulator [Salipiger sp. HF18]
MCSSYEKIKRDLKRADSSLRAIARELGVSHTAVVDVAKRERRSAKIAKALAEKLQVSVDQLWTDKSREKGK